MNKAKQILTEVVDKAIANGSPVITEQRSMNDYSNDELCEHCHNQEREALYDGHGIYLTSRYCSEKCCIEDGRYRSDIFESYDSDEPLDYDE